MRPARRALRVLAVLLLAAGVIAYVSLDRILRRTVETEGTSSMRLSTTLHRARLSLFGGKLNLNDLRIGSPKGFSAPQMLEIGDVDLAVRYGQLRENPIHVRSLTVKRPRLVIEQSNGALNFKAAADRMPPSQASSEKPIKLVIDELDIQDAQVVIHPGLPGLREEIVVPVPAIALKNVGGGRGSQNGAAMKDVALVVISELAKAAARSDSMPAQVRAVLQLNAGQLGGQIAAAVPGEVGKALEGEIGGLLGGKKSDSAGRAAPVKR